SKPAHGAAPELRGMMRGWIGPGRSPTFVVCVIEEALRGLQVAGINDELFRSLVIGIRAFAEESPITHQKRHPHEYAIAPELVLAAGAVGVPEATVRGSGIGVETLTDLVCRELVSLITGLLV